MCNKLKDVVRTGWKDWHVNRERVESIAEHIYGTQMLAIAMYYEYEYKLDLKKILYMLAIHEIGETVIGDLTMFQITKEEKEKMEHEAVKNILKELDNGKEIEKLFLEFDKKETPEAKFAYYCDKLECDLQSKLYDEENCVDLDKQEGNTVIKSPTVQALFNKGLTWGQMWMKFGQDRYNYDENFKSVSDYALNNKIRRK